MLAVTRLVMFFQPLDSGLEDTKTVKNGIVNCLVLFVSHVD